MKLLLFLSILLCLISAYLLLDASIQLIKKNKKENYAGMMNAYALPTLKSKSVY
jgi:hypothetical protein